MRWRARRRATTLGGSTGIAPTCSTTRRARASWPRLRASHLLHLAWYAEPGAFWTAPRTPPGWRRRSGLVDEFAAAGGRRAVLAGTCAEYDWTARLGCCARTRHCAPATFYGVCKDATRRRRRGPGRAARTSTSRGGASSSSTGPGSTTGAWCPASLARSSAASARRRAPATQRARLPARRRRRGCIRRARSTPRSTGPVNIASGARGHGAPRSSSGSPTPRARRTCSTSARCLPARMIRRVVVADVDAAARRGRVPAADARSRRASSETVRWWRSR